MRRAFAFAAVLALGVAAVASAPSCTTETAPVIDTGCPVSGTTPKISIASPADGACVEVSAGSDAFIPVIVVAENFKLDPPGACGECEECGHIALEVNGQYNNSAASPVVDLQFEHKIANHFGELELKVTLVGDDGSPWVKPVDGGIVDAGAITPVSATVKITTAKSCAATSSSSSSGTGGTGGAASSSSSSGTGGTGTGGTGGAASSSSSSGTGGTGGAASSSSSSGTGGTGGTGP